MFDALGIAMVGEAGGELVEESEPGFDFAEQQRAGVGGDATPWKSARTSREPSSWKAKEVGIHSVMARWFLPRAISDWWYRHLPAKEPSGFYISSCEKCGLVPQLSSSQA
jgi:hypothetical protein